MKSNLLAIFTVIFFSGPVRAQQINIFKSVEFVSGQFYRQTFDTVKILHKPINIYFFRHHFYSPYYLPEKFINKQYKNRKVSIWAYPPGKKNNQGNWENTYTFDSLGRVVNYTYSSCVICSSLPYNYDVVYNLKGQVTKIFSSHKMDSFKFYYDRRGNVVKYEKFMQGELERVITLLK